MLGKMIGKVIGTKNDRELKRMRKLVDKINALEPKIQPLSDEALKQVLKMVTENKVISRNGKEIDLETDTICVHGDGKHALEFVEQIRKKLTKEGIDIQSL